MKDNRSKHVLWIGFLICALALALLLVLRSGVFAQLWHKRIPKEAPMSSVTLYEMLTRLPWVNLAPPPRVEDFQGRVILMDFWTFCCINCMHVIPDLHRLEEEFGEDLLVLGIHSAKFDNEKDSVQILESIEKYGIKHAVANDSEFVMWRALGVRAWPTFVLVGVDGRLITLVSGEGVYAKMRGTLAKTIAEAKSQGRLKPNTLRPVQVPAEPTDLRFPGKLWVDEAEARVWVSDSEHHQIRAFSQEGNELLRVGSGIPGLKDGSATEAQFQGPQGMVMWNGKLMVADTDNHALREVDPKTGVVKTAVGTGKQARASYFKATYDQELNSPWDVAVLGKDLIIAMAGSHQLYKMTPQRKLERFAGSGVESLDDGKLSLASLAQPSALSVDSRDQLFFLDSETSSLRGVKDDEVVTLIGQGLFEFGWVDGVREKARMQHPLGLVASEEAIYVADTYNHAIRVYDRKTHTLKTLSGGKPGYQDGPMAEALFREPNGIQKWKDDLWIADTHNHRIRILNLKSGKVSTVDLKPLSVPAHRSRAQRFLPNLVWETQRQVKGPLTFKWLLPEGTKLNAKAPSFVWWVDDQNQTLQQWELNREMASEVKVDGKGLTQASRLEGTLYYCNVDQTGACYVASFRADLQPGGMQGVLEWKVEE
jgi:thiol-disulfide isomerase/thioredoxin